MQQASTENMKDVTQRQGTHSLIEPNAVLLSWGMNIMTEKVKEISLMSCTCFPLCILLFLNVGVLPVHRRM